MEPLTELKQIIKEVSGNLLCETHPECCRLRDESYPRFEALVLDFIFKEPEPVSVQTAFTELEVELQHAE